MADTVVSKCIYCGRFIFQYESKIDGKLYWRTPDPVNDLVLVCPVRRELSASGTEWLQHEPSEWTQTIDLPC